MHGASDTLGKPLCSLFKHDSESKRLQASCSLDAVSRALAVELLLAAGFVNAIGEHGETLLHLIASGGCDPQCWEDTPDPFDLDSVHRLIHLSVCCGVKIEARDEMHSATALSWAAWFRCYVGLRAMLVAGADRDAIDIWGSTSAELALGRSHVRLEDLELDPQFTPPAIPVGAEEDVMCELRLLHGPWAESRARYAAAMDSLCMAKLAEIKFGLALPGSARLLIARFAMQFECWTPVTLPIVGE